MSDDKDVLAITIDIVAKSRETQPGGHRRSQQPLFSDALCDETP
jgi:hypothetical protein